MKAPVILACGLALLAAAWLGPLPQLAQLSFVAHMAMHLMVLVAATPLIGYSLPRIWPSSALRLRPAAALVAAGVDLVVIWSWHTPAMHAFARQSAAGLALEQGSFLAVGVFLWTTTLGPPSSNRAKTGASVLALLITSVHMTLLGALIGLSNRQLYNCYPAAPGGDVAALLRDQQLGGALMLVAAASIYAGTALWRLHHLLNERAAPAHPA